MRTTPEDAGAPASTADYLADREGLDGRARVVFLQLLHDVFGFRITTPRWGATGLVVAALLLTTLGAAYEARYGRGAVAALPWAGIAGAGVLLAVATARRTEQSRTSDRELEWRAYCLLVRPMILLLQPGLLDRNLRADRGGDETIVGDSAREALSLLRVYGADSWWSTMVGWAIGSLAAIVWRVAGNPDTWFLVFPVAAAALAPPVWSFFRLLVFRRVHRSGRRL